MTTDHRLVSPLLDPAGAAALKARVRDGGPYGQYVAAPVTEGIGAGLTRRHDAALAWIRRQIASGSLESMEQQAARANLFRRTWMERGERFVDCGDVVDHPGLAATARELLGAAVVEPYMLYANLLLPGQELPAHHDTPEFAGLDKTVCPEWFLVVCGRSGLFEDRRIRVASAVVFIDGPGPLVVYPGGPQAEPTPLPPTPNTAVVLDADELVHGVARVGGPDTPPPPVVIGMQLHATEAGWALRDGDAEVQTYADGEVRLSLQWKAWLFDSPEHRAQTLARPLTVAEAVPALTAELHRRGLAVPSDDTDLALALMDAFIELPAA